MLTAYIIRARPCKHSDVISLKYTDIRGGSLDWISGFQSGFLDFKVDFWISDWISGFQSGFLDFVGFLDFRLDFCRQCTRFLSWRTPRAFLLLPDTNLLPQAGITHYSQLLTRQHSTKLLLVFFFFFKSI